MSSFKSRGLFVCIEGCDRAGKSTQAKLLVEYIKSLGRAVEHFRFPDRSTAIGKCIDSYLQGTSDLEDHAIHLLFSANRWEAVPKMKRLLHSGTCIITDRYAFSGVAFTAAKGYDTTWCMNPERGLPLPDLTVYLDISTEKASKRSEFGEERYENSEFQEKVSKKYQELITKDWKVIDATQSIEKIHQEIKDAVDIVQKSVINNNELLKELWTWPQL
ncbi:thymidylate kinase [Exaiptasia diaphana]|uniref:Thymidylate kinase n=1 Tax=Exaiptasia diaphana TaxID=2652724 RepID=A0A913X5G2_EXADI|nr:thymidylate kinase [Exaiptasia diaphana]XP_020899231.1 thymidylate kinase [Exaiptasia diaphana]KXJ15035.1 Thymidylate kinase [Exaiptasia diaphana]KXJ16579.1 Thymidylate kinase [Exaiptasia diaphana]